MTPPSPSTVHRLLGITLFLKALHAFLEIGGGIALYLIPTEAILGWVRFLTQHELGEDPGDRIASALLRAAEALSLKAEHLYAFLFLGHGLVNLLVVIGLWTSKPWANPLAIVVLSGFILYQLYEFSFSHSPMLLALTLIDVAVIWLIWLDHRQRSQGGRRS